ncbi:MAG: hypothetical protein AAF632_28080 [Bacteroidota bacterium]
MIGVNSDQMLWLEAGWMSFDGCDIPSLPFVGVQNFHQATSWEIRPLEDYGKLLTRAHEWSDILRINLCYEDMHLYSQHVFLGLDYTYTRDHFPYQLRDEITAMDFRRFGKPQTQEESRYREVYLLNKTWLIVPATGAFYRVMGVTTRAEREGSFVTLYPATDYRKRWMKYTEPKRYSLAYWADPYT